MKNFLFKVFLALVPKKKQLPQENRRILIVSTTGLGDSLWGTPAVRALRKKYPTAHLALLTSTIGEQIFRNNPHLNTIYTIKGSPFFSCLKLLSKLRKERFDTALIFHTSQRPILPFVSLAGPSTIIGTSGINKGFDHLLTRSLKPEPLHEIKRRLLICDLPDSAPEMELFLTEEENDLALTHLPDAPLIIGLHPGAKDKFKQWDPKYFVELGRRLAKEKRAIILITGDKNEVTLAEEIAANIPRSISLAGKLPLRATAALIEKMDLFITNDTGPMHLAFAMETPTLALFAPTDPKLCGPYQLAHAKIIQKPLTCKPCIRKRCQEPFCMMQIFPQEVYDKALSFLK